MPSTVDSTTTVIAYPIDTPIALLHKNSVQLVHHTRSYYQMEYTATAVLATQQPSGRPETSRLACLWCVLARFPDGEETYVTFLTGCRVIA